MHAEGIVVESDPVGSGEDPAAYAGDVDGVHLANIVRTPPKKCNIDPDPPYKLREREREIYYIKYFLQLMTKKNRELVNC